MAPQVNVRIVTALVLMLTLACAGSIPSIPDAPEAIVAKGDAYFQRGKYFQASELYKAFLERYPGHDLSDRAQYQLGESYFNDGQFTLAAVEYRIVVSNFGYSEFVDDALFKTGVCFWREAPKVERDQQKTRDALDMFQQFIQTFPNSDLVPEAQEYIGQIHERLAEKAILTARWYQRQKRPKAALIYCDRIISEYPDNIFWAEAHYIKGSILLRQGNRDDAVFHFNQVISYAGDTRLKRDAEAKIKQARKQ